MKESRLDATVVVIKHMVMLFMSLITANIFSQESMPVSDFGVTVSPIDGSIVYYSSRNNPIPDLYIKTLDGIERNITNSPDKWEIEPAFSPDGKYLAYGAGDSMGDLDLIVMEIESGESRKLAGGIGTQSAPSWHPSGKQILYTDFDMVPGKVSSKLKIVSFDGENIDEIVGLPEGASSYANWSRDGERFVFTLQKSEQQPQFHVYDLRNNTTTQITHTDGWKGSPVFSLDDQHIYYVQRDKNNNGVYKLNLQTGVTQELTENDGSAFFVNVSPKDEAIYFSWGDRSNGYKIKSLKCCS